MPKKPSIEVSDKPYGWLCGLSDGFNLDVKQTVEPCEYVKY